MLEPGNTAIRFYLNCCLSNQSTNLQKFDEAVSRLDEAISTVPPHWEEDEDISKTVANLYRQKAMILQYIERPDDSIQAYNASRAVHPNQPADGSLLDDMTRVFHHRLDPSGSKLLDLLRSWNNTERMAWFTYMFDYDDTYAVTRLNHIVARNGNEGTDFILQCYKQYTDSLPPRSDKVVSPEAALAYTFQRVTNESQKARELYRSILQRKLRDHDNNGAAEIRSKTRLALSDMVFTEFQACKTPGQKVKLLQEMKQLSNQFPGASNWIFLEESNMSVSLALMTRAIGTPIEYEELMRNTFEACIEGLSDSVGWNDSSSFRLLAKVLACVEGLERDALIAISCQFSKVTLEASDSPNCSSEDEVMNETAAVLEEPNSSNSFEESETRAVDISTTITSSKNGVVEVATEIIEAEEINTEVRQDTDTKSDTDTTIAGDPTSNPTESEPAPGEAMESDALPEIEDEDILDNGPVTCDGECDGTFERWHVPLFYCIFCPSTDLCSKCHAKRVAQNRGESTTYWRSYCGKDHYYLKGPIKGWKGVKNGIIRIEGEHGEVQETEFNEWLRGLKEERWVEAWENFWLKSANVRDVGL
jgi:hypothetical protein